MSPQSIRFLARASHRLPGVSHGACYHGHWSIAPAWRAHGISLRDLTDVMTYWRTVACRPWRWTP